MESSNLVTKITSFNQVFQSNFDPSLFEKAIDKLSFVLLLLFFFRQSFMDNITYILYYIFKIFQKITNRNFNGNICNSVFVFNLFLKNKGKFTQE